MIDTYEGKITSLRDNGSSVDLVINVQDYKLAAVIKSKRANTVTIRLEDGRRITQEQRRKIYATLNEIAEELGYIPEEAKQVMKYYYISKTGEQLFSLSDCSVDTAREFLNVLIDFCLERGVKTQDSLSERTDDIDTYLYQCIRHRKCSICGKQGEIHHWDAIGMGHDRRVYDDSNNRKICLCREHHVLAHQKGVKDFARTYHVYGIICNEN